MAMTGNAIREALEPFARAADGLDHYRDNLSLEVFAYTLRRLTVGDLRRARTAYDAIGSGVEARDEALAERFTHLSETLRSIETLPKVGDLYYAVKNDGEGTGWRYVASGVIASDIHDAASALSTHTAAGAGPVGDFVLVPREPTEAMLIDGVCAYLAHDEADDAEPTAAEVIYRAMVASAPTGAEPVGEAVAHLHDETRPHPNARAICEALGFDPTNHHNAAKCPYCAPVEEPGVVERLTRELASARRDYAELDKATEAEIERWRENSRANWEAFSAMRNDINELVGNMASGEAALINGPEMQHQCEAVATSVRDKLERQERLLLEASSDAGKWEDRCRAAETALAETRERLEKVEALLRPFTFIADTERRAKSGESVFVNIDLCRAARAALTSDAQEAGR